MYYLDFKVWITLDVLKMYRIIESSIELSFLILVQLPIQKVWLTFINTLETQLFFLYKRQSHLLSFYSRKWLSLFRSSMTDNRPVQSRLAPLLSQQCQPQSPSCLMTQFHHSIIGDESSDGGAPIRIYLQSVAYVFTMVQYRS